jgi:hypothetical protein
MSQYSLAPFIVLYFSSFLLYACNVMDMMNQSGMLIAETVRRDSFRGHHLGRHSSRHQRKSYNPLKNRQFKPHLIETRLQNFTFWDFFVCKNGRQMKKAFLEIVFI